MAPDHSWRACLGRTQTASSDEEAFARQYQLETSLYPNQALMADAPRLAIALVQGLPQCTEAGRTATFESLTMLACGCLQPFGAPEAVVRSTRRALLPAALEAAVSQVRSDTSPSSASLQAVALLGVLWEFSGAEVQRVITCAVRAYASSGASQAAQVANEFPRSGEDDGRQ